MIYELLHFTLREPQEIKWIIKFFKIFVWGQANHFYSMDRLKVKYKTYPRTNRNIINGTSLLRFRQGALPKALIQYLHSQSLIYSFSWKQLIIVFLCEQTYPETRNKLPVSKHTLTTFEKYFFNYFRSILICIPT